MSMRFLATLGICSVLAGSLAGSALAADPQKKPEDFRDVKWGAPSSSLPGLVQVDRDGDIIHYERQGDKKELSGVTLSHVTYSFYKNKFYHAEIDYQGKDAAQALQQSLEAKYGPPDDVREKKGPDGQSYEVAVWNWPGAVFIGNRHTKDGSRGRVFYFYAPLTDASAKSQGIGPEQQKDKPAPAASAEQGYKVRKGDSLERIAKRLGVTEEDVVSANPGLTDKKLKAGATIAVPGKTADTAPVNNADTLPGKGTVAPEPKAAEASPAKKKTDHYTNYTVKDGDVLSKVAHAHGVRTKDIIAANPGIKPDALRLGMTLRIPPK